MLIPYTPLKERSDWPWPSFDARDWAEAFCKVCKEKGFDPIKDEDWVMGWFANALMRGFDEGTRIMPVRIECPLCQGYGAVVWEYVDTIPTPRAPHDDEAPTDECPACNGCGTKSKE